MAEEYYFDFCEELDWSSNDENMLEYLAYIQPEDRREREDMNYLEMFNAREYQMRYRLTKETVERMMTRIENQISYNKIGAMTVEEQVHPTLRYYATGTFQSAVADMSGKIHQTSAGRVIGRVSRSIAEHRAHYICMPRGRVEIETLVQEFYSIAGFPYVIGDIDGSHVRIIGQGGEFGELFRNRKGYFSLNIQNFCDYSLRIRDLVTRWFGSAHDSTILAQSRLRADFETGNYAECIILGDCGYANSDWLVTPFVKPKTAAQTAYNTAHILTRNPVERCFGVWYRRFPVLSLGIRLHDLQDIQAVIVATACCHNQAIDERDPVPPDDPEVVARVAAAAKKYPRPPKSVRKDRAVPRRDAIVEEYFQRRC